MLASALDGDCGGDELRAASSERRANESTVEQLDTSNALVKPTTATSASVGSTRTAGIRFAGGAGGRVGSGASGASVGSVAFSTTGAGAA